MTTFNEREKAFEDKFAHDEELTFKANIRAAKLIAQWAAEEINVAANTYVDELVNMVTGGKDSNALIQKIEKDAANKGKNISKAALEEKYSQFQNQAREYVIKH